MPFPMHEVQRIAVYGDTNGTLARKFVENKGQFPMPAFTGREAAPAAYGTVTGPLVTTRSFQSWVLPATFSFPAR